MYRVFIYLLLALNSRHATVSHVGSAVFNYCSHTHLVNLCYQKHSIKPGLFFIYSPNFITKVSPTLHITRKQEYQVCRQLDLYIHHTNISTFLLVVINPSKSINVFLTIWLKLWTPNFWSMNFSNFHIYCLPKSAAWGSSNKHYDNKT